MIVINLLPYHLRPIQRTPVPYILSIAFFLLIVGGMAGLFLSAQNRIAAGQRELQRLEADLAKLTETVEEFNQLSEKKQQLEGKISIIKTILSDRIIWSEQLHRLATLTPDNIWYKGIRVTWQNFKEKKVKINPKTGKPVLDPKTKRPQTETTTIRRPVLEISGYVINDEQGESKIYPLTEKTTTDPDFKKMFTLLRPRVDDTEFAGFAVRGFTLEYQIELGGGD